MHWPPNYRREVLVEGDMNAMYTGETGGVQMSSLSTPQSIPANVQPLDEVGFYGAAVELDDPSLFAFAQFLDEVGFD